MKRTVPALPAHRAAADPLRRAAPAGHDPAAGPLARTAGPMPAAQALDNAEELLDAVDTRPEDRVLIVGGGSADLLCASLRRGCRAATGVTAPPRHPEPAEVVLAPRVASVEEAAAIARSAHRALAAGARSGRLALALLGAATATVTRHLAGGLRAGGYDRVRVRARARGGLLVTCRLQFPGAAR